MAISTAKVQGTVAPKAQTGKPVIKQSSTLAPVYRPQKTEAAESTGIATPQAIAINISTDAAMSEAQKQKPSRHDNVQLPSGEWISKTDWKKLTPQQKNELMVEGVAAYNKEQQAQIAKFKAENTELTNGDWISNKQYNALDSEQKDKLNKLGVQGFMNWQKQQQDEFDSTHVKLDDDTYILKSDYDTMSDENKAKIKTMGVDAFNVKQQASIAKFEAEHVKLDDDTYLAKADWDSLTSGQQKELKAMGAEAFSTYMKGLTPQQKLEKYKEWSLVDSDVLYAGASEDGEPKYLKPGDIESLPEKAQQYIKDEGLDKFNEVLNGEMSLSSLKENQASSFKVLESAYKLGEEKFNKQKELGLIPQDAMYQGVQNNLGLGMDNNIPLELLTDVTIKWTTPAQIGAMNAAYVQSQAIAPAIAPATAPGLYSIPGLIAPIPFTNYSQVPSGASIVSPPITYNPATQQAIIQTPAVQIAMASLQSSEIDLVPLVSIYGAEFTKDLLVSKGYEAASVSSAINSVQKYLDTVVALDSGEFADKKEFKALESSSPELASVLKTQGFSKYSEEVDKLNTVATASAAQVEAQAEIADKYQNALNKATIKDEQGNTTGYDVNSLAATIAVQEAGDMGMLSGLETHGKVSNTEILSYIQSEADKIKLQSKVSSTLADIGFDLDNDAVAQYALADSKGKFNILKQTNPDAMKYTVYAGEDKNTGEPLTYQRDSSLQGQIDIKIAEMDKVAQSNPSYLLTGYVFAMNNSEVLDNESQKNLKALYNSIPKDWPITTYGVQAPSKSTITDWWNSQTAEQKEALASGLVSMPSIWEGFYKPLIITTASMIPGISIGATIYAWKQMPSWMKVLSIAGDILMLSPVLASATKGVTSSFGIKGIEGVKISNSAVIPTAKGDVTVWKGISANGKPIFGISDSKFVIGDNGIKLPGIKDITPGYEPITKIETSIMATSKVLKKLGVSSEEINKLKITLSERGKFAGKTSPYLTKKAPLPTVERLTQSETGTIFQVTESYGKKIDKVFGTVSLEPQLSDKFKMWRPKHDIDIQTAMTQSDTDLFTKNILKQLQKENPAIEYKIDPKTPGAIEKKINGKWEKITDIHSTSETSTDALEISPTSREGSYGMMHYEKPVSIEYPGVGRLDMMTASEMGKRKAQAILRWFDGKFQPYEYRIKDITDFYVIDYTFNGEDAANAWAKAYGFDPSELMKLAKENPPTVLRWEFTPESKYKISSGGISDEIHSVTIYAPQSIRSLSPVSGKSKTPPSIKVSSSILSKVSTSSKTELPSASLLAKSPKVYKVEYNRIKQYAIPSKYISDATSVPVSKYSGRYIPISYITSDYVAFKSIPVRYIPSKDIPSKYIPSQYVSSKYIPVKFIPSSYAVFTSVSSIKPVVSSKYTSASPVSKKIESPKLLIKIPSSLKAISPKVISPKTISPKSYKSSSPIYKSIKLKKYSSANIPKISKKGKIGKLPLLSSKDKSQEQAKVYPDGTVAWTMGELRAGKVYHVLEPPYRQKNYSIVVSKTPPKGVKVTTSAKVAETIRELGGKLGKDVHIDIGAFDLKLKHRAGRPTAKFYRDIKTRTHGDVTAKGAGSSSRIR